VAITLDDDELWRFLEEGHEGLFSTLRADGWPVTLPVWYVVVDRAVYLRTSPRTKKLARVRRDGRSSFAVSSGERWVELKAVVLTCQAVEVAPGPERDAVFQAFDDKYRPFRLESSAMPSASRRHYQGEPAVLRLDPVGRPLSWDNARLRLPGQDEASGAADRR
jgi:nitroimidazol reductase NimA-like FMN-containing flavoprotein (pyridoxamine 5'-phosphate oxidase superfamily)